MAYEPPLEGKLTASKLLELIYPVDSIYMSTVNVSPATFLGGTWVRIQDTFLLASGSTYSHGTSGGSATVTLSSSNIPAHTHSVNGGTTGNQSASHTHSFSATTSSTGAHTHQHGGDWDGAPGSAATLHSGGSSGAQGQINTEPHGSHTHTASGTTGNQSSTHTHSISLTSSSVGQSSPSSFSIMPPYRVVYMWRRTA